MSSVCSIAFHLNRSFNHLFFNIVYLQTWLMNVKACFCVQKEVLQQYSTCLREICLGRSKVRMSYKMPKIW